MSQELVNSLLEENDALLRKKNELQLKNKDLNDDNKVLHLENADLLKKNRRLQKELLRMQDQMKVVDACYASLSVMDLQLKTIAELEAAKKESMKQTERLNLALDSVELKTCSVCQDDPVGSVLCYGFFFGCSCKMRICQGCVKKCLVCPTCKCAKP